MVPARGLQLGPPDFAPQGSLPFVASRLPVRVDDHCIPPPFSAPRPGPGVPGKGKGSRPAYSVQLRSYEHRVPKPVPPAAFFGAATISLGSALPRGWPTDRPSTATGRNGPMPYGLPVVRVDRAGTSTFGNGRPRPGVSTSWTGCGAARQAVYRYRAQGCPNNPSASGRSPPTEAAKATPCQGGLSRFCRVGDRGYRLNAQGGAGI